MFPNMLGWTKRALGALGLGAGILSLVVGLLVTFQEKLIYVPRVPGMANFNSEPSAYDMDFEDIRFEAADGTRLHAWFAYPKGWTAAKRRNQPTFIFLQENAGSMALRLPFLQRLTTTLHCSVLAPSYRGYGKSEGSPTEAGIKQDTQAALNKLLERSDVDPKKISVIGKSLGGATAIHLTAANPKTFRCLVIENTFTSIEDVAHKVLPPLKYVIGRGKPLNFLIRNKWRNYEEIAKIKSTPMLLLSALQDEMLPPAQMRELYRIARDSGTEHVTWVDFENAHHMDAYEVAEQYWPALMHFVRQHYPELHSAGEDAFDSEESTEDFEVVGDGASISAMKAAEATRSSASVDGIRARHAGQKP